MTHIKSIALAGAVAVSGAFAAGNADALGFTVLNSFSNSPSAGDTGTAADFGADYGANFLGGTFAPGINVENSTSTGLHLSPWDGTSLENTNSYFSVQPTGSGSNATPQTLTFGTAQDAFLMLWGSIDTYNTITFYDGANGTGSTVGSWTGTQITNDGALSGCGGSITAPGTYDCVAEVAFSGDSFLSIAFGNTTDAKNSNAFEFATIPLPAAAWLLMGVTGGLVAAKRRQTRRAA